MKLLIEEYKLLLNLIICRADLTNVFVLTQEDSNLKIKIINTEISWHR